MTQPRQIVPGRYYLITRRCSQRQFLLRPGAVTNAVFEFILAESAELYGIEVVAWMVMSNHYHAVVRDPLGRLPHFLERLHQLVARVMNAHWGRWESFWNASEATCVTYLVTEGDVFDKVVYTLANPVAEHLVDRVDDWPGSSNIRRLAGGRALVERPAFFRRAGPVRETAQLSSGPPVAPGEAAQRWAARVRSAVKVLEDRAREERRSTGRRVVGRAELLSASFRQRPQSHEPRRTLRPNVACKDSGLRVQALRLLKGFRRAYRRARKSFIDGLRDVLFPEGTWALRWLGVRCGPTKAGLPALKGR